MFWTRRLGSLAAAASFVAFAAFSAASASADPAGKTTLQETIQIAPGTGFRQLEAGPGEPYLTRQSSLGKGKKGRAGKRRSMLFFGQVSDAHIRDEMAPARIEFADAVGQPLVDANRPQEAFSTQVFDQMIRNINLNRTSTVRQGNGRRDSLRFLLSTGDDTDSEQTNELGWFTGVLKGGTIDPFSGKLIGPSNPCPGQSQSVIDRLNAQVAARQYSGVQNYANYSAPADRYQAYWDPNQAPPGGAGPFAAFPRYPGLLDRAQAPFNAQGIQVPWYDVLGNHDGLAQGVLPASLAIIRAFVTSCNYIFPGQAFDPASLRGIQQSQLTAKLSDPTFQQQVLSDVGPVPPDPTRQYYNTAQFRAVHGSGLSKPMTPDSKELRASNGAAGYYAFTPRKGFRFIALDTVAEGGGSDGNLDNAQYKWLKRELDRDSAVKWKGNKLVRTGHKAKLIVLTSHHALNKMNNNTPDEKAGPCSQTITAGCDRDPRKSTPLHLGTKGKNNVRDLVLQYPDVIAWVDGHDHKNRVTPYVHKHGKTGFWDINTTSHTDWPEGQSRLIDIMDNRDGTLSLFNTILNSAAPIKAPAPGPAGAFDEAQLASLARLISANDYQGKGVGSQAGGLGTRTDRNVELLIRDPRRLR